MDERTYKKRMQKMLDERRPLTRVESNLAALSVITPADGTIIVGDGSTFVGESGATARTSLGIGTGDGPTFDHLHITNNASVGTLTVATYGVTVEAASTLNQDMTTDASPTFANLHLVGADIDTNNDATARDLTIDCGTEKTVVLTQVVYDDLRINPGSFDRPGASDPAINTYAVGGGGVNTYCWEFAKTNLASFTVQLPHTYKQGGDISVHLHWTPGARGNEENGNTVGWKVDYSWATIDGTFGAMSTADLSDTCDGTDHKHQMTTSVTIDGHTAQKNISSMLLCNVKRTDTGTDDTWSSIAAGEHPILLEVDFHYPIDTQGSRQASAK